MVSTLASTKDPQMITNNDKCAEGDSPTSTGADTVEGMGVRWNVGAHFEPRYIFIKQVLL